MQTALIEEAVDGAIAPLDALSERVTREIERLERGLQRGSATLLPQEIRRELRFLRQLAGGLASTHPGTVWYDRAGYGSLLLSRDEAGRERFHKLVSRRLDPLDAAQVALGSAFGRALFGRRAGDVVEVRNAAGPRRLRIVTLKTLPRRLGMSAPGPIPRTEESACTRS